MMTRLIFFCGHAGTGKTTLAKQLIRPLIDATGDAFCLLDKDTLYGRYSAAAMNALTHDPDDRDSPVYLQNFRDPEYQGLLDTARENLASGIGVLVIGPLSREVRDKRIFDRRWLQIGPDVDVRWVWVTVPERLAHERIIARAHPNDAYKLAHWDEYRQRRFEPEPTQYPQLLIFDNSAPSDTDRATLLRQLVAPPAAIGTAPATAT
jgi:predicted kinase